MEIVKNAFEYYDNIVTKHKPEYYSIDHNKIKFYDKKKKEIKSFICQEIGIYSEKIWTWLWAIPTTEFNKKEKNILIDLLNYGLTLEPYIETVKNEKKINKENIFIKTILLTSSEKIPDHKTLDMYFAIICYLTKKKNIFLAPCGWNKNEIKKYYCEKSSTIAVFIF